MAIIYQHKRNDTGDIFYIGIGTSIARSRSKSDRSDFWWKVVNKCGYTIEVIQEDLTWEEACKEEIRLIKLYGRKNKGLGELVNLTDGGEGNLGYIPSKEFREEQSRRMLENNPFKGRTHSKYSRKLMSLNTIKMIQEKGHPMLGKKHRTESKKLITEKSIGRVRTEESKNKQSKTTKNLFKSPEYKKILSESNKGEKNAAAKLTKEDVIWIRKNAVKGTNQFNKGNIKEIALKYNITPTSILNILRRKTWKHLV